MRGVVTFDVYEDVSNGYSAWLIKKTDEEKGGKILYYSREGAVLLGDSNLAPTLILSFDGED